MSPWASPAQSMQAAHSVEDLRNAARARLPRVLFDFYDGGAEEEHTLRANREAFQALRILPHVLVDVAKVRTECTLVGGLARAPMAIAPTGGSGYGHHDADIGLARAAAHFGIPYTLSTSATASIEDIARAAPGARHWFQAYILRRGDFLDRLIERARVADFEALMITVDLPVGGKRERDLRNGYRTPFRVGPRVALDALRHPRWLSSVIRRGLPPSANLIGLSSDMGSIDKTAAAVGRNYDPSFDWARLQELRDGWPRRLIVKGVQRPEDAKRLATMGVDAIVVSNHGGRQLDSAQATLLALPAVVEAVAGRIPVLVDGGVRRGVDVLKARALGAQGVLTGRATLYGALAAGEAGARRALEILTDELARAMRLSGVPDIEQVQRDLLAP